VIDLERALVDLAEHLDHPDGHHLADTVRQRIASPASVSRRRPDRARSLVAVAAVFVVMVMAALAISPARHAIADWLGIGAVEVRRSDRPPLGNGTSGHSVPGLPGGTPSSHDRAVGQLAQARKIVDFAIVTPGDEAVGQLSDVEVDRRVPGGLVALGYARFTLVEVAADAGEPKPIAKLIYPATRVEPVTVNGSPGLWITGAHSIGYLDRSGRLERDTVRRSGSVLIWERAGVTYRIEGFDALRDAQNVAASIR
jgi:hypothetical protein